VEEAVPLIYLDEKRSFGGSLDDAQTRLAYYHSVIEKAIQACRSQSSASSFAALPCSEFTPCCCQ
jgi:hypothetical protein